MAGIMRFWRHLSVTWLSIPAIASAQICVGGAAAGNGSVSIAPAVRIASGATAIGAGIRANASDGFASAGIFKSTKPAEGESPTVELRVGLSLARDAKALTQICLTGLLQTARLTNSSGSGAAANLGAALSIGSEVLLDGGPSFLGFASLGYQRTTVSASAGGVSITASEGTPFAGIGAGLQFSRTVLLNAELITALGEGAQPLLEISMRLYVAK